MGCYGQISGQNCTWWSCWPCSWLLFTHWPSGHVISDWTRVTWLKKNWKKIQIIERIDLSGEEEAEHFGWQHFLSCPKSKKRLASGPVGGQMLHRPANNTKKSEGKLCGRERNVLPAAILSHPRGSQEKKGQRNDYLFDWGPPLGVDLFIFISPSLPAEEFFHISALGLCYVGGDLLGFFPTRKLSFFFKLN